MGVQGFAVLGFRGLVFRGYVLQTYSDYRVQFLWVQGFGLAWVNYRFRVRVEGFRPSLGFSVSSFWGCVLDFVSTSAGVAASMPMSLTVFVVMPP